MVVPSGPYTAKGLLLAALHDPDPVLFLEPTRLYRLIREEVPEGEYIVPLGKARVAREGGGVTVIAWGSMLERVLKAVGPYDAEVIDLLTLNPFDAETILASVRKIGRVVIVHEAVRTGGFGAESSGLPDLEFVDDRGPRRAGMASREARAGVTAADGTTPAPAVGEGGARAGGTSESEIAPAAAAHEAVAAPTSAGAPSSPSAIVEEGAPLGGTLGELLTTAREARGLSIEEASSRTRISTPMLRNLENDRFSEFAAEAYVRGFLRSYGIFLGLDVNMLLRRYEALVGRRVEPAPDVWPCL